MELLESLDVVVLVAGAELVLFTSFTTVLSGVVFGAAVWSGAGFLAVTWLIADFAKCALSVAPSDNVNPSPYSSMIIFMQPAIGIAIIAPITDPNTPRKLKV